MLEVIIKQQMHTDSSFVFSLAQNHETPRVRLISLSWEAEATFCCANVDVSVGNNYSMRKSSNGRINILL